MKKKAHAIMFHHFCDGKRHIAGGGAITAQNFSDMLDFYAETHNIIPAKEFLKKAQNGELEDNDVCLAFDDGLLNQYEVAYPVMRDKGLTGFWFVYTSPLDGVLEKLEIYRHFRYSKFRDIEDFYEAFFDIAKHFEPDISYKLQVFNPNEYKRNCPFYTPNDRRFRYLRDEVLGTAKYNGIMDKMIVEFGYDIKENAKLLWMTEACIKELNDEGHIIGLHSHTHPTVMTIKSLEEQREEYGRNKIRLERITKSEIISAAYPCGLYDRNTITCMKELGIQLAFRADMADIAVREPFLEVSREDHANIMKAMEVMR